MASAPQQGAWPRGVSHGTTSSTDGPLNIEFVGRRGKLFWLALKMGFWTILTLGIYRFWMKTRMRRYYWSSIRPGGHPLEYTGDPFEKLLGFLIAVVILTFYIGIVNLLLVFLSFSLFGGNIAAYWASFLGVVPLWFYASYRARRYVLARTRWRGVRFALEPAAWRYAGRALMHWAVTILSLGLLWPRMTFYLEKFRTDRTVFGDLRLRQGGRWPILYRAMIPFVVALGLSVAWGLWVFWLDPIQPGGWGFHVENIFDPKESAAFNGLQRLWFLPALQLGLIYGVLYYAFVSKRILADHKTANGVSLKSNLRAGRVFGIYVFGYLISYITLMFGLILILFVLIAGFGMEGLLALLGEQAPEVTKIPRWLGVALLGLLYFGVFLLWSVFHNVFVTFPLMRHQAQTLTLPQAGGLVDVSQRARDEFAEAEGFAEALDLGAAI